MIQRYFLVVMRELKSQDDQQVNAKMRKCETISEIGLMHPQFDMAIGECIRETPPNETQGCETNQPTNKSNLDFRRLQPCVDRKI
jgi:hypothetical protein